MSEVYSVVECQPTTDIKLAGALQAVLRRVGTEERDYSLQLQQDEAMRAIGEAILDGHRSGYVEMATSSGKTAIEALVAEAAVRAGRRVLVLAPTITIAQQFPEKGLARFAQLPESTTIRCHFGNQSGNTEAHIVMATYSGFLQDYGREHATLGTFDVIIADECHRSLGEKTSKALRDAFPGAVRIGFSATPDYATNRLSEEVYGDQLYEFSLVSAIESGHTAPVRTLVYETDARLNLSDNRPDFTDRELAPLIENPGRNAVALSLAEAFVKEGRQGLIACIPGQTNLHARLLVGLLRQRGVRATDIGAHLTPDEQAERLRLYQEGYIDVLTFTRALEEGWDSDRASFAINMAPTTSPVRTTQLLGRILRKKPDGREGVFVDFVDPKTGVTKGQYTALHALGLEKIDYRRVLGIAKSSAQFDPTLQLLQVISPDLLKKLHASQGKLLLDISISASPVDPLFREWEKRLADEGMPAELDPHVVLPPHIAAKALSLCQKYWREEGVAPTAHELLDALGIKRYREKIGEYLLRISYDEAVDELTNTPNTDLSEQPDEQAIRCLMQGDVRKLLDMLSEREAGVISMRLGLFSTKVSTYDEIGQVYGVTRERIRQIEKSAIMKLRILTRHKGLRGYVADRPEPEVTHNERYQADTSQRFINSLLSLEYSLLHGVNYRGSGDWRLMRLITRDTVITCIEGVFGSTKLTAPQKHRILEAIHTTAHSSVTMNIEYGRFFQHVYDMIKDSF